jgi:hypothetical protein
VALPYGVGPPCVTGALQRVILTLTPLYHTNKTKINILNFENILVNQNGRVRSKELTVFVQ